MIIIFIVSITRRIFFCFWGFFCFIFHFRSVFAILCYCIAVPWSFLAMCICLLWHFLLVILLTPGQLDFLNTESLPHLSRSSWFVLPKSGLRVRYLVFCPHLWSLEAWGGILFKRLNMLCFYTICLKKKHLVKCPLSSFISPAIKYNPFPWHSVHVFWIESQFRAHLEPCLAFLYHVFQQPHVLLTSKNRGT